MTFDPNDPRLTAYLLGEIDPAERPEIEAMLETSSEGQQAVEEIRQTIGWLTEQLREEQAFHSVTADSNHKPLPVFSLPSLNGSRPWWRGAPARLAGLAALLLLAATAILLPSRLKPFGPQNPAAAPQVAMEKRSDVLLARAPHGAAQAPAPRGVMTDGLSETEVRDLSETISSPVPSEDLRGAVTKSIRDPGVGAE